MTDNRIERAPGEWKAVICSQLDEPGVALAIEERAGFTHRPEKLW